MELLHIYQQTISGYTGNQEPKKGFLWLLLERSEPLDIADWIFKTTKKRLHERHVDDIKQSNHPCSYDSTHEYDLIVFRNSAEQSSDQKKLFEVSAFIIFDNLLVTIYDKSNPLFAKIKTLFTEKKRQLPSSAGSLAEFCLNFLIDRFLEVKQSMDGRLNLWQKKLLQIKTKTIDWNALLAFKTDIRRLKMLSEEQVDALNAWNTNLRLNSHHHPEALQELLLVNLSDLIEHANRSVKIVTQQQQELESLMQLHFMILNHRTNEIMRILALVTCIFLPPNLITGIFGMNFTSVPDLSKPHAFYYALFIMCTISLVLWLFFRWRKWI